jgi:hypothetical protein
MEHLPLPPTISSISGFGIRGKDARRAMIGEKNAHEVSIPHPGIKPHSDDNLRSVWLMQFIRLTFQRLTLKNIDLMPV